MALSEQDRIALNTFYNLIKDGFANRIFPDIALGDLLQEASQSQGEFVNVTGDNMTGDLVLDTKLSTDEIRGKTTNGDLQILSNGTGGLSSITLDDLFISVSTNTPGATINFQPAVDAEVVFQTTGTGSAHFLGAALIEGTEDKTQLRVKGLTGQTAPIALVELGDGTGVVTVAESGTTLYVGSPVVAGVEFTAVTATDGSVNIFTQKNGIMMSDGGIGAMGINASADLEVQADNLNVGGTLTLRSNNGVPVNVNGASLAIVSIGRGLKIAEGSNATMGVATLVAGTVTVANTTVTATSRIHVTGNVDGGVVGFQRVSAIVPGVSFTITSSSALDTSTVSWFIIAPA